MAHEVRNALAIMQAAASDKGVAARGQMLDRGTFEVRFRAGPLRFGRHRDGPVSGNATSVGSAGRGSEATSTTSSSITSPDDCCEGYFDLEFHAVFIRPPSGEGFSESLSNLQDSEQTKGSQPFILCISRDVSDRKLADEQARRREAAEKVAESRKVFTRYGRLVAAVYADANKLLTLELAVFHEQRLPLGNRKLRLHYT
jgi:hypothetical protein